MDRRKLYGMIFIKYNKCTYLNISYCRHGQTGRVIHMTYIFSVYIFNKIYIYIKV